MKRENKIALIGTAILTGLTLGTAFMTDVQAEEVTPQIVQRDKEWITLNSIEFEDTTLNSGVKQVEAGHTYDVSGTVKFSGGSLTADMINMSSDKDFIKFGLITMPALNTAHFFMEINVPSDAQGTLNFKVQATGINDELHNITPYSITDTLEVTQVEPDTSESETEASTDVPEPNSDTQPSVEPSTEPSTEVESSTTVESSSEVVESSTETVKTVETTSSQSVSNVEQPTQETNKPLESSSDDTKKAEKPVTAPVEQTEVKELPKTGSKTNKPLIVIGVILVVASLITLCYNEYTNRKGGK